MSFEKDVRAAAHAAEEAVEASLKKYRSGKVTDEPDLTGVLVGQLDARLEGRIGDLTWSSTIVRSSSGKAAQEKRIGADLLINVQLKAHHQSYNKGVLIQSKRVDEGDVLSSPEAKRLHEQCVDMVNTTFAAYVFVYAQKTIRCGGAASFFDAPQRDVHRNCPWTSYRFFWELFRCPIGDPLIRSPRVEDLPVPNVIRLTAIHPEASVDG